MVNSVSSGMSEVDKLLGGGLLPGSAYLVEAEPGTEELSFIAAFLDQGLLEGDICGLFDYDVSHEQIIARLSSLGVNMKRGMDSGSMVVADMWGEGDYDPERRGPVLKAGNVADPNSLLRVFHDMAEIHKKGLEVSKFNGSRSVIYSLSSQIMRYRFEPTYKLTKASIDMIRQANSIVLSILSPKMVEETTIVAFEHLHDGIIVLSLKDIEKNRFQRFIRVKQSPISGYFTDEIGYEIVDNRPHLVSSLGR